MADTEDASRATTPAMQLEIRSLSPSPSASPTPAISACPYLERSVSTASSVSTFSGRSASSRSSETLGGRRRGYVRPQATSFSESAKNRESVMSLGSIAHLQYYFARTGLLDGKGAQLAKSQEKSRDGSSEIPSPLSPAFISTGLFASSADESKYPSIRSTPDFLLPYQDVRSEEGIVESPVEEQDSEQGDWDEQEPIMLPPTVSTYNYRTKYVPPPPKVEDLRRDLREALVTARKALQAKGQKNDVELDRRKGQDSQDSGPSSASEASIAEALPRQGTESPKTQGWYEIEGMHILDVVTLAIRAAKLYYTAHEEPARLLAIKSERRIREELLTVLDVLKRMATRNFEGGMKAHERDAIDQWATEVEALLLQDEEKEKQEIKERESWEWLSGDWTGREMEREFLFMQSLDKSDDVLPRWTPTAEATSLPTPFLASLQNGVRLVNLHNEFVRKSKRPFGKIKAFHTDTAKPYRCAENLRFWIKAAEIRWEIQLKVDVMEIVHGESDEAWKAFEAAIFRWCTGVREELTREWTTKTRRPTIRLPTLFIQEEEPDRNDSV